MAAKYADLKSQENWTYIIEHDIKQTSSWDTWNIFDKVHVRLTPFHASRCWGVSSCGSTAEKDGCVFLLSYIDAHIGSHDRWRPLRAAKTPPPFHSICKKRKLGQCADQLCRRWRWFYILAWFVKAGASAFQHKIHTRVTSLRPTVCCTEERFTFHSQRWALQAKNCTTLIKFEFEVVI